MSDEVPYRRMLIGGELVDAESGQRLECINPATEEVIGAVPLGDKADVDRAVTAALEAYPAWACLSIRERASCLRSLGRRFTDEASVIVTAEVSDTGNTISRMRGDVHRARENMEYFAGLGLELKGETIPASATGIHLSMREPFGVVGRITAFNHPFLFASRIAAPLMAGNTVVLKPSEQSPLSTTFLGELCAEMLPPGVVNIVTGLGRSAGDSLVRHPDVKRIAFTGSVPTGQAIQASAATAGIKQVSLELGGKNPMIVFPDAEIARVSAAAVAGMNFGWQGQSCGSLSRLFVHESIYEPVVAALKKGVEALRLGDPLEDGSDMGPINSRAQYEKVVASVREAIAAGATVLVGGKRPLGPPFARGFWFEPTVFTDVDSGMRLFHEEIFGPVLSVIRWSDDDEMLAAANDVDYGLTASVWTNDLSRVLRFSRALRAGYVWVNEVSKHYMGCEFGGVKSSGIGREEGLSELLSYTETKTVHLFS